MPELLEEGSDEEDQMRENDRNREIILESHLP